MSKLQIILHIIMGIGLMTTGICNLVTTISKKDK